MNQEILAGIVITLMGLGLNLFPEKIWKLAENWKTKRAAGASNAYFTALRVLGAAFAAVGLYLIIGLGR